MANANNGSESLAEVKCCVRSVLQSEKHGIPLRRFGRAYAELVGEPLPFWRFGCRTLVDFIAAIDDTARLDIINNERYVTCVSSDTTAHIEDLLRGQKSYVHKSVANSGQRFRYNFAPEPEDSHFSAPINDSARDDPQEEDVTTAVTKSMASESPESSKSLAAQHLSRDSSIADENELDSSRFDANAVDLSCISDEVMAQTLKVVLLHMPIGLALSYFAEEYRNNFGNDLNLSRISVHHFFKYASQVLPIEVHAIDDTKRAFLKRAADVDAFLCATTRSGRHIFANTMLSDALPADVAMPGDVLTGPELPVHVKVDVSQYVSVLLSAVKDPYNMCIQFDDRQSRTISDHLSDELNFYHTIAANIDDWIVPKAFRCVGLPVIGCVDGRWCRARIEDIVDEQFVTLLFVDFGGETTTRVGNVLLMRRELLSVPIQGFRVGLYGVKPASGEKGWSDRARDDLLERFSKREYCLACAVVERVESHYYLVCLCDTNDERIDVFVHEFLVQHKHAVYEDGVTPMADSNGICDDIMDSMIDLSGETSSVWHPLSTSIQTSLTANQTLPVVRESLAEQNIIDLSVSDEEEANLAQPLIPRSVSTAYSPKSVVSLTSDSNCGVSLDELHRTAQQIINEANRYQSSVIAIRDENNNNRSDVPLTHKIHDKLDSNSIISAKLKIVLIASKSYALIYFMDSFYFTYFSVNEMFKDVPLWQTIRKSGGLLKNRIQFGETDGRLLFWRLNIDSHLRNGTAFLYPYESVANFASINKLRFIRDEINSNVRLFYKEILIDEKNKLSEMQRNIDNKLKSLKI